MNSVCGRIEAIFLKGGVARARVDVAGISRTVSLVLLLEASVGDEVIVDEDVALSRIGEEEAVV